MAAQIVLVSPDEPRPNRIRQAAGVLDRGGVVAIPTETFYGLAVDGFSTTGTEAANRLKGKAVDSPVLLLLSDRTMADQVAVDLPEAFHELTRAFWPGPLTLVVRASRSVPPSVSGGRGTVAIRVPGLALPRHLAAALGRPISGISSNRHGGQPHRNAVEVFREFPEGVDMILDGGPTPGGAPSTIVDLSEDRPRVIRRGTLPVTVFAPFLPDLQMEQV
jgi:L-threonylcarbamoyladenylate synthase